MEQLVIRRAEPRDRAALGAMCHLLWPDASAEAHMTEMDPFLAGKPRGTLPTIIFLAESSDGRITGFIDAGLRSHADGCDPTHPVGFVEGWFVAPEHRRNRIGAQLLAAAEQWARDQGCHEMASDTWIDHLDSQQAHQALGFQVVDRCVHYRKRL
ncbi:MAG TPA: GNAT family N-acetyltransferase [Candidatus Angelobacter sp.]|jgi:aminoglycoside 6'-N-acetyltransferase I